VSDHAARNSGIQVIKRAAIILRVLRDAPGGLSLGQIANRIDLPRSTVQRIIQALQEERLVSWSRASGGVVLGHEMRALAEAARFDIVGACRIILQEITEAHGETTDLSVMRAGGMILLDQMPGTHRLRTVTPVGEVFPLAQSANGRACLALQTPEVALALVVAEAQRLAQPAVHPAARASSLAACLAQVHQTGLAYDLDEHTPGICAIGIGFRDGFGECYAISVPIPRSRFAAQRAAVELSLTRARATVDQLVFSAMKASDEAEER
jgi:DNA-binding IclR family transcriptional regulator